MGLEAFLDGSDLFEMNAVVGSQQPVPGLCLHRAEPGMEKFSWALAVFQAGEKGRELFVAELVETLQNLSRAWHPARL